MVGDLCNPINKGESNTVRITGVVPEMRVLDEQLDEACGPLKPHVCNERSTSIDDLRRIVKYALAREDDIVRRTRRFKKPSRRYVCTFETRGPRIVCGAPAVLFIKSSNLKHADHVVRCKAHEHD